MKYADIAVELSLRWQGKPTKHKPKHIVGEPYPALRGASAYDALLLHKRGTPAFERACNEKAKDSVDFLHRADGMYEFGTREELLVTDWSGDLYRGSDAGGEFGPWWFDGAIVRRWESVYDSLPPAERRAKVLQACRAMLAVSLNWKNKMEKLYVMRVPHAGIPVITGQGKHKPKGESRDADAPPMTAQEIKERKEDDEKVFFIGGYQQVFVPIVPTHLVMEVPV